MDNETKLNVNESTVPYASQNGISLENMNLNLNGLEVKLAAALGDVLIGEYYKKLTDDDKKLIFDKIDDELFSHSIFSNSSEDNKYFKTSTEVTGYYGRKEIADTPLYAYIKKKIQDVLCEDIEKKINEIIISDEYKNQVDSIANEIVDYATEGYKKDLKDRIRERLVDNVIATEPCYNKMPLKTIIHECINERLN